MLSPQSVGWRSRISVSSFTTTMAQEAFPLHVLVWNNQYLELDRELQKNEVSEEVYFAAGGWCVCVFFFFCYGALHCADAARVCWFYSRMWSAWIREGAPRWSWPFVSATWSLHACCWDTPQTRRTATRRAGPVSVPRGSRSHVPGELSRWATPVTVCFSPAGGCQHRGSRVGPAGASIQRL